MGRVAKVVLASLLLLEAFLLHAMAEKSESELKNPPQVKARSEGEPGWVVPREAAPGPAATTTPAPETKEAEAPAIRRLGKHHSSDKSVAGGGVIIGGLVTVIFAAVFAYIRVTRKRGGVY